MVKYDYQIYNTSIFEIQKRVIEGSLSGLVTLVRLIGCCLMTPHRSVY